MTTYAVRVPPRAREQIERIDEWWRENRADSVQLFVDELEAAIDRLRTMPMTGVLYEHAGIPPDVRQLLMPRTRYHLFYVVEPTSHIVTVLVVWHATRGRGPTL